ncbi:MAG: hypothetical protein L6R41_005726 [Letrouitia leprolyta]|nr:MAG: hypothetical protein L6R41_005726 [Letrouitia leprolyta]
MDFIEGIGQSYLNRKAYAIPQQLENLAKKQFSGGDAAAAAAAPVAGAKANSTPQNIEKDKEIERLRRELAETKLNTKRPKVDKEVADAKTLANIKAKRSSATESPVKKSKSTSSKQQPTKSTSKPPHNSHATKQEATHEHRQAIEAAAAAETTSKRGRPPSAKTATAAKKPPLDLSKFDRSEKNSTTNHSQIDKRRHHTTASTPHHDHQPAITSSTPVHRVEKVQEITSRQMTQKPRPATNYSLVEVIDEEEEPPRRERRAMRREPVAEVVEKDRRRTRYVVR